MYSYDRSLTAKVWPTPEARTKYLIEHPQSDPGLHTVRKKKDGPAKEKGKADEDPKKKEEEAAAAKKKDEEDSAAYKKRRTEEDERIRKDWGETLQRQLGRKPTDDDFVILRGQMKEFIRREKAKQDPDFEKKPDPNARKPDKSDPFVKQWEETLSNQLGRPATEDDIDILKSKMKIIVRDKIDLFPSKKDKEKDKDKKAALLSERVVFKFLSA
jgi:hypothetical protein